MLSFSSEFLNLSTNKTTLSQGIQAEINHIEESIHKIQTGEIQLSPKVSLLFLYKRLCDYYTFHNLNLVRLFRYSKAYGTLLKDAKPNTLEAAEAHSNAGTTSNYQDEKPFQTALKIYQTLEAKEPKTHSSGGPGEIQCGKIYVLFGLCLTALIKNQKQTALWWINEAIAAHRLFLSEKKSNPDLLCIEDLIYTKQEITMQVLLDNYEKSCTKENDFKGDPQKLNKVIDEFKQLKPSHQEKIKQNIIAKSHGYSSSTDQTLSRCTNILKGSTLLPIVGFAEMVTNMNITGPVGKAIVCVSGAAAGYFYTRSKEAYQLLTEQRRKPFLILRRQLNIEGPLLAQCLDKGAKPPEEQGPEGPPIPTTLRRRRF